MVSGALCGASGTLLTRNAQAAERTFSREGSPRLFVSTYDREARGTWTVEEVSLHPLDVSSLTRSASHLASRSSRRPRHRSSCRGLLSGLRLRQLRVLLTTFECSTRQRATSAWSC